MQFTRQELVSILEMEIVEREATFINCDDSDGADLRLEIDTLKGIMNTVNQEMPLEFNDYVWLCDLVSVL